jgi:hypothetical protein
VADDAAHAEQLEAQNHIYAHLRSPDERRRLADVIRLVDDWTGNHCRREKERQDAKWAAKSEVQATEELEHEDATI